MSGKSKDYRVVIPDEAYAVVEFKQEGKPGVMVINSSLKDFEPKLVFSWHLSVMINFEDMVENGMPSEVEQEVVEQFEDKLERVFKGDTPEKPNALFFARITWNNTRELIYRAYQPEPIHDYLQAMIDAKSWPRTFDYRIDPDPEWKLAKWHLGTLKDDKKHS
jgi:hypothetical protein